MGMWKILEVRLRNFWCVQNVHQFLCHVFDTTMSAEKFQIFNDTP